MNYYQRALAPEHKAIIVQGRDSVLRFLTSPAVALPQHNVAYNAEFVQELFDADDCWDEFRLVQCQTEPSAASIWSNYWGREALNQRWIEVERHDKSTVLVRVRFAYYLWKHAATQRSSIWSSVCCRTLPALSALVLLSTCGLIMWFNHDHQ